MRTRTAFLSTLLVAATSLASAQDIGQHPAVFAPRHLPAVDPSTFIVAHPASLSWRAGHANFDHPAVTAHSDAQTPEVDANTFLVQPPAHVDWTSDQPMLHSLVVLVH